MCARLRGGSPPRPPAELVRQVYFRPGGPRGAVGRCWHCGRDLPWDRDAPRGWHVDHWPVALRDIRRQVLVGVTDPLRRDNLVPSCVECNTSHRHERVGWHGCTQFPCTPTLLLGLLALAIGLLR